MATSKKKKRGAKKPVKAAKKAKPAVKKAKSAAKKTVVKKKTANKAVSKVKKAIRQVRAAVAPKVRPLNLQQISSALKDKITPLDDRIVVSVEAVSETTPGGIIIPSTVSERPNRGTVLAKGRGRRNKKGTLRPLDVNVGDSVLFPEFSGTKIEIGGHEVLILREEDILGIVT